MSERELDKALRQSEARKSAVLNAALDALIIIDAENRIVDINPAAERLFGYTRQMAVGREMPELIIPAFLRERHRRSFERHLQTGDSQIIGKRIEMPAMRSDGKLFPVELAITRIDVPGGPLFAAHLRDITEQRRSQEELIRLAAIVESSDDAIIATTISGVVVSWNRGAEQMYGYPAAEVLGRVVDFLEPAEHHGQLAAIVDRVRQNGAVERYETVRRRKDGSLVEVSVVLSPLRNSARDIIGLTSITRDITERKRAEEALQESRAFLEQAQQVGHIGSWVSGLGEDDHLFWSRETYRIFGIEEEQFDGRVQTFFSFVHVEDRARIEAAVETAVARDEPYDIEHRIVWPDGSLRWVHERADIVRDAQGRPVRLLGTVQDITERRQLEEQLLQAQKMEAIGTLAGGVAHDFNNILTTILGYANLLHQSLEADHPLREDLEEIQKAAERASALTRQLLAFSRKQVLMPAVFDLNAVVADLEKMLRRLIGEDIELVTDLDPELGHIQADPGQVEQIILNLCVNARDAMSQGGRVTIETRNLDLDDSYIRRRAHAPSGPHILLAVSDTGQGMDEETRSHIFEPFFTTKGPGKGTGLGLSTVYGIVKQSGGHVEVESEPGRGTTFRVYFPVLSDSKAAPAIVRPVGADRGGAETVLLVEDEDSIRNLVSKLLAAKGYKVMAVGRAEAALEVVQAHPAPIDLLLTDVVMPGMSGPELASIFSQIRPATRVLLMSGYLDRITREDAALHQRWRLLEKPFKPETMVRTVREVLDADA